MSQSGSAFFDLVKEAGGQSTSWFSSGSSKDSDVATGNDSSSEAQEAPAKHGGKEEVKQAVHGAGAKVADTAHKARSWFRSKVKHGGDAAGQSASDAAKETEEASAGATQKGNEYIQGSDKGSAPGQAPGVLDTAQNVVGEAVTSTKKAIDDVVSPGAGPQGEAGEIQIVEPGHGHKVAGSGLSTTQSNDQMAEAMNRVTDWGGTK